MPNAVKERPINPSVFFFPDLFCGDWIWGWWRVSDRCEGKCVTLELIHHTTPEHPLWLHSFSMLNSSVSLLLTFLNAEKTNPRKMTSLRLLLLQPRHQLYTPVERWHGGGLDWERDTTVNEARETAISSYGKMFWAFELERYGSKRRVYYVYNIDNLCVHCYSLMLCVFLVVFVYKIPQMCKYSISLPNSLEI